jgi:hypothetical protein
MKGEFDKLLLLIYIADMQSHVGQVVQKLGNTETIGHAMLLL